MLLFQFPEDGRWSDERDCVEFSVILGPYEGTVRIARRVFRALLDERPTPERCIEAFHLQRTRFEMITERKLRRRQLTEDGNVELTGRDLREKTPPVGQGSLSETAAYPSYPPAGDCRLQATAESRIARQRDTRQLK